jgi:hypothetical protein
LVAGDGGVVEECSVLTVAREAGGEDDERLAVAPMDREIQTSLSVSGQYAHGKTSLPLSVPFRTYNRETLIETE